MKKLHKILALSMLGTALSGGWALAGEAPELAALVSAGTLPPLEERLPANPVVVTPETSVGKYGGTWRSSLVGGGDQIWLMRANTHETMLSWDRKWTGALIPNVAESMDVSEDARVYTFRFREGMKWSDGAPFTVDDFIYYFEDVAFNTDISEIPNSNIWPKGNQPTIEKVDERNVRITFANPYGLFPIALTSPFGAEVFQQPKHYCSQFHPKYNPDAEANALAAGAENWAAFYRSKCMPIPTDRENFANAEKPMINGWIFEEAYVGGAQQVSLVRNPYYWKVDTEGNQLPYIDGMQIAVKGDAESLVLSALNGEIDLQDRNINAITNRALFTEASESSPFRVIDQVETSNTMLLQLNLNTENPVLSKVFNNKNFRIALSHAIDRQAIIDAISFGIGTPSQAAPNPNTPFYSERLATQYIEYNPAEAERILDEAGFAKGPDGVRRTPDGEQLTFVCTVANFGDVAASMELVVNYWKAIGIDARLNAVDRATQSDTMINNQHECIPWAGMTTGPDLVLDPRIMVPNSDQSYWARGWAAWYNGSPTGAVEPPPEVKEVLDLYDQVKAVPTEDERNALMLQITELAAEQFWTMGLATTPPKFIVANDDVANVPEPSIGGWNYLSPAASGVEQFYFDR